MPVKKTTQEFIADARKVHGDKYDYSKVVYDGVYKKVCIICPEHGEFWQRPYDHLTQRRGCKLCSNKQTSERLTKDVSDFLENAERVHGDQYDYSQVVYVDRRTPVTIICHEHGPFIQTPQVHLHGSGCPKCGKQSMADKRRLDISSFISKAEEKYGNKYDYSQLHFVNSQKVVNIICPTHGAFRQYTYEHLRGAECPSCAAQSRFIDSAMRVHGGKYSYEKVSYVDNETPVCITCPKHGDFWQRPHTHLRGRGCPRCGIETRALSKKGTTQSFIEQAIDIHGNVYDYSQVEYVDCDTPVTIICPKHGSFLQTPFSHNNMRHGCPKCHKETSRDRRIEKNTGVFFEQARLTHGDKYDYSLVEFKGLTEKVDIICPVHGLFRQQAGYHIRGGGCPKCYSDSKKNTLPELIERFRVVHHDKYDYSKTVYQGIKQKIIVICPTHGEFLIRPDQHLEGYGCHECAIHDAESQLEKTVRYLLDRNGLKYIQQASFDWLRSRNPLFLDFFLPEFGVAIECQGLQHFQPISFFGGARRFKEVLKCDEIKRASCAAHGIQLLYFAVLGIDYPYPVIEDLGQLLEAIKANGKVDPGRWKDPELPLDFS